MYHFLPWQPRFQFLHVTCDVIGVPQNPLMKAKMAAMYFADFPCRFSLENVTMVAKTALVALITFNKINLSKMSMS